MLIWNIWLCR